MAELKFLRGLKTNFDALQKSDDNFYIVSDGDVVSLYLGEKLLASSNIDALIASEIAKVVSNAPEDFDTLKEIYDYITNLDVQNPENKINGISIEGNLLEIVDKIIEIPLANYIQAGVVKSSDSVNKIHVDEDGTMEVNSVGISKLVQEDDVTLVFDSGDSSL